MFNSYMDCFILTICRYLHVSACYMFSLINGHFEYLSFILCTLKCQWVHLKDLLCKQTPTQQLRLLQSTPTMSRTHCRYALVKAMALCPITKKVCKVTLACCVLYNVAMKRGLPVSEVRNAPENLGQDLFTAPLMTLWTRLQLTE